MRVQKAVSMAIPLLLMAGSAFGASSGTPLDTISQQAVTIISGPIALLLISAGFAGATIIFFMGRSFETAFITFAALLIGGILASQLQTFAAFFFPGAVALLC